MTNTFTYWEVGKIEMGGKEILLIAQCYFGT